MNIKKNIISFLFLGLLFSPILVFAQGVTIPNPLAGGGINTFGDLLLKIASGISTVVAAIATIMIIWAGILYLVSAGSPERMSKAKTTLTYAIIGLIIGISATAIVVIIKDVLGVK